MSSSSLSVVLPVFNGAKYVSDSIKSILSQQDLPDQWELIVVDDGSLDDSLAICQEWATQHPQIQIYALGRNQGVAVARSTGISLAKYHFLGFVDQDDQWAPNKWLLQYEALHRPSSDGPTPSFVLGHQMFYLETGMSYPNWFKPEWATSPQKGYVFGTMLITREAFLSVGYSTEWKHGWDDVAWFTQAKALGLTERMSTTVLLHRRIHDRNASSQTAQAQPELLRLIRHKLMRTL
jgi:glycosyltransferase involved in cell wall biosynthesis